MEDFKVFGASKKYNDIPLHKSKPEMVSKHNTNWEKWQIRQIRDEMRW